MVDHWSNFYAQSNDVFKLLANSTDILFGQSDKLQNFLDGPPTTPVGFLQYILKLNSTDAFEQFNFKMDRYQSLYKLAFPERKKPLPNTPHVVATDVHQINISINPAFSSKALRPGETETFPIWSQRFNAVKSSASESALSSAENIVLVLVNQGITANIVMLDEMVSGKLISHCFVSSLAVTTYKYVSQLVTNIVPISTEKVKKPYAKDWAF